MPTEFKNGFTLIEVVVAIVILALSIGVVANNFASSTSRALKDKRKFEESLIITKEIFKTISNTKDLDEEEATLKMRWIDRFSEEEVSQEKSVIVESVLYRNYKIVVNIKEARD